MNRSVTPRRGLVLIAALIALCAVGVWLYGRGGGPLPQALSFLSDARSDPLAESDSDESALRTMRLAGFERAVVGAEGGSAVLRVELPTVTTAADLEIAWQTGYATLAVVYPDANEYVIQLFEGAHGLLELSAQGSVIRQAVSADDAFALKEATDFTFLRDKPGTTTPTSNAEEPATQLSGWWEYVLRGVRGAVPPPSIGMPQALTSPARNLVDADPIGIRALPGDTLAIDRDVSGAYLDAKNAAAGSLGVEPAKDLRAVAVAMRAAVGGIPAPEPGKAAEAYVRRIVAAFTGRAAAESEILGDLERIGASEVEPSSAQVLELRTLASAAEAIASPHPYGSVLRGVSEQARDVADSALDDDRALRNAVLAAVLSPAVRQDALSVLAFEREPSADVSAISLGAGAEATATVAALFASHDQAITWQTADDPRALAPQDFQAYRRADGTQFWVGSDDSDLALREATLDGWAFSTPMAAIVSADQVGQWFAVFPVQVSP